MHHPNLTPIRNNVFLRNDDEEIEQTDNIMMPQMYIIFIYKIIQSTVYFFVIFYLFLCISMIDLSSHMIRFSLPAAKDGFKTPSKLQK